MTKLIDKLSKSKEFSASQLGLGLKTIKTTWLNTFIKYALYFFYLLDIRLLSCNKRKSDILSIGTKLQSPSVNSPKSAVCHVTGVNNGKCCVCRRNPKSSTISNYSSELM